MCWRANELDQVLESQKELEREDVPVSVLQLMSGILKSPTMMAGSEEAMTSVR